MAYPDLELSKGVGLGLVLFCSSLCIFFLPKIRGGGVLPLDPPPVTAVHSFDMIVKKCSVLFLKIEVRSVQLSVAICLSFLNGNVFVAICLDWNYFNLTRV